MKEIKYNSGGQPFFIEDDELQQSELFKAIEQQYADTAGVVLSGCNLSGTSISAGLVYLDGKVRELPAATGLTFPCYIKASAVIENDTRPHLEDSLSKTTKREFNAEITATLPTVGDFITVGANGVDKRLQYIVRNEGTGQTDITGFQLNAGKVSNVNARRNTDQSVPGNTLTVISYNIENVDELNEFAVAGEFAPQQAGLYMIDLTLRVFSSTNNNSIDIVAQRETSPGSGSFVDSNSDQFVFVNGVFFTMRILSTIRLQAQQRTRHRIRFQNASGIIAPGTALNIVRIG